MYEVALSEIFLEKNYLKVKKLKKNNFKRQLEIKKNMTICHKFDEAITMKSQNQSFIANRPSFMITDILSKAAVDKPVNMQEHSEHLKHLERFSAFSDGRLALHHGFGMMTHPSQGKPTFYDSEDDFHGSDDVDGGSSDGE